ncbi:hypothetical protein HMN09_01158400 [Mycena chlorophos]|uniref:KOW domain-containing protein n=1 Tax=Mycena chlorophos TaxID=658473 RepID=A0A8H6SAH8_MYCCL|nr:hypothetical protein HMN09_01158400 [Mycena chlorophos]
MSCLPLTRHLRHGPAHMKSLHDLLRDSTPASVDSPSRRWIFKYHLTTRPEEPCPPLAVLHGRHDNTTARWYVNPSMPLGLLCLLLNQPLLPLCLPPRPCLRSRLHRFRTSPLLPPISNGFRYKPTSRICFPANLFFPTGCLASRTNLPHAPLFAKLRCPALRTSPHVHDPSRSPPLHTLARWRLSPLAANLTTAGYGSGGFSIAPGTRVVLVDPPQYMAMFVDGYVLDFPFPGTARVRIALRGCALRHEHPSLVDDLASPCDVDDYVVLPTKHLRRHVFGGRCFPSLGDRVESPDRVAPYRAGYVASIDPSPSDPMPGPSLSFRDFRDGVTRSLLLTRSQPCFSRGDRVLVCGGPYAGYRGVVTREICLASQFGPEFSTAGAFSVRLISAPSNTDASCLKSLVSVLRQDITFPPPIISPSIPPAPLELPPSPPLDETWLCAPELLEKRLDVFVLTSSDASSRTSSPPRSGFVELDRFFRPQRVDLTVLVHFDGRPAHASSCAFAAANPDLV